MKLGGIYVDIGAKTSGLKRDLEKSEGMVSNSARKMQAKLSSLTFKYGMIAAAAFGTAVVYNMKKAVDAASDLEEVVGKFGVVFKDQIVDAEKNSKVLVDSYAMSTREAKQYLSSVQDLLVPMGMAAKQAGNLSFEVTKLAADLGSFNNLPTERVMLDIQSALVGNFETMKKYGVVLNEKVVQQEAFTLGLAKTKDEINANIKAQAAYSLMLKGSAAATGDLQRTSGSYANQMKQFHANIENLRAELGNNLLPILTPIVKQFNDWVKANKELISQDVKKTIEGIKDALIEIKEIYDILPESVISPIGLGLVGTILFGPKALVLGFLTDVLIKTKQLKDDLKDIYDDVKGYMEGGFFRGKGVTGSWDETPPSKEQTDIASGLPAMGGDNTPLDNQTLKDLEAANFEYQAALVARSEMEIFLESGKYQTLKDMAQEHREWEMEMLTSGSEYRSAMMQDEHTMALEMAQIQNEELKRIDLERLEWTKNNHKKTLDSTQYTFNTLMDMSQGHSKAIFEVMKAAAIANSIVSTYAGAANAMATVPYPYNFAAAASVIAYGLAQVQQIRAQSFSGGGGGGGAGGGAVSYENTPTYNPPPYEEEEKKGSLTINIQGDFIGDESYIELLAEKISEAVEDKDVKLIASNAKYAEAMA